jgi:hypothetical protein
MQALSDRLSKDMEGFLYEWRVRKEISSDTAMTVMRESRYQDSLGYWQRQGMPPDNAPFVGGAVPNKQ